MNKYQKIAVQMAKDDAKKGFGNYDFREVKNLYYRRFAKKNGYNISKALDYKNWNKDNPF